MARQYGTSILLAAYPTAPMEVTPKQYVDDAAANASNLNTGTVGTARLPNMLTVPRAVNPSGGVIAIDADMSGTVIESTLTTDATLNVPTNGTTGLVVQGIVLASGAQRILTFHASFGRLTAITNTLTIPSGKIARYAIRRTDITGSAKWLVESVGVEQ